MSFENNWRNLWTSEAGWVCQANNFAPGDEADLAFVFGATALMKDGAALADIRKRHPKAYICGCSTAGEIAVRRVLDDSVVETAVKFSSAKFCAAEITVAGPSDSFSAGKQLATSIPGDGLVHAFVLSDGLAVNGSELVKGIASSLPPKVAVTGGLSGDGARFAETYVCANGIATQNKIVLLGFYGEKLRVGYGSMGGWDLFGLDRRITRSKDNVLYELDGRSAPRSL